MNYETMIRTSADYIGSKEEFIKGKRYVFTISREKFTGWIEISYPVMFPENITPDITRCTYMDIFIFLSDWDNISQIPGILFQTTN